MINNYWITYFKAIGIILMVVGHSGAPKDITNFVYLFHMAMFFFISGYLYKDTENPIKYFSKKVKSLYIPFIKWQIMFLAIHNILFNINIYNNEFGYAGGTGRLYLIEDVIKNFFKIITFGGTEEMGGAMWFLPALFSTSIIFYVIRFISVKMINKRAELVTLILVLLALFIGYNTNFPRNLSVSLVSIILFWLGFKYKEFEHEIVLNYKISFVCLLVLLVLNQYGSVSMGSNDYTNIIFFAVSSLCGIYLVLYMSKILQKHRGYSSILMSIGDNTLYIMILHFISFKIVSLVIINIYGVAIENLAAFPVMNIGGVWFIIYSIIGIIMPIVYVKFKSLLKIGGNI